MFNKYLFMYLLVKLSYVQSLIVSETQNVWSESEKFCTDKNNHQITSESILRNDGIRDDICDLLVGEQVWLFGISYQLGCVKGICDNIEVTMLPSGRDLDFLCQRENNLFFASGSSNKPYNLAMAGCGPRNEWPKLANLSTDVSTIENLIKHLHIKEDQQYWVQDFHLNMTNGTCKVVHRATQSFAKIIKKPCYMLAKSACQQGPSYFQKAVRYFKTDGSQDDSILKLNCSESDLDITTTEPQFIEYVDHDVIYDVVPGVKPSDGNFSNNSTETAIKNTFWNINILHLICGAAGGCVVVIVAIIVIVVYCVRTKVEVMPYGEPKDLIRKDSQYRYENPYDARKNFEKVVKIKELKTNSANYDYPDVVIDTEKAKISSTYDEIISTNSTNGGSSVRENNTNTTEKIELLLEENNATSKSSTQITDNLYTYIDVASGPKFTNTISDTDQMTSAGINIKNNQEKESVYL